MSGVLQGFGVIGILIGVGFVLADRGVLAADSQRVLSRLVYYVATPALLVSLLGEADLSSVLGVGLAVAALSVLAVAVVYVPLAVRAGRSTSHTVIGLLCASYQNGGYLGLPIAVYVLGDAAYALPIMVLQLVVYAPIALSFLDLDASGRRPTPIALVVMGVRNPVSLAAVVGVLLAVLDVSLPHLVAEPLSLLGAMAVPGALLAFGVSLRFGGTFAVSHRTEIVGICALKLVWQPLVAYLLARLVFDLASHEVFGLTVMAALPAAQNVFVYASRFDRSVLLARDGVAATTVLSIPVMLVVAALLA